MNKMKIFNLVYKIKKVKTEKSGVVDRLEMAYISMKKGFKNLYIAANISSYYLNIRQT